mmetsp:Transcript_70857/g.162470  ORF Transcript_70857/g.162470 Transcript_70857/m.162470 type:complete len:214 (-) Transcript_70857:298-939(-)
MVTVLSVQQAHHRIIHPEGHAPCLVANVEGRRARQGVDVLPSSVVHRSSPQQDSTLLEFLLLDHKGNLLSKPEQWQLRAGDGLLFDPSGNGIKILPACDLHKHRPLLAPKRDDSALIRDGQCIPLVEEIHGGDYVPKAGLNVIHFQGLQLVNHNSAICATRCHALHFCGQSDTRDSVNMVLKISFYSDGVLVQVDLHSAVPGCGNHLTGARPA